MKAESSYFSNFIMRARPRARQNHFFWKFLDFGIFSEFPAFKVKLARARARGRARMIKFEKYELSAFTGKKINKFGQKAKILEKNENAHEIRKKGPVYVRAWKLKKKKQAKISNTCHRLTF